VSDPLHGAQASDTASGSQGGADQLDNILESV
jgi:hypothetical protein